MPALPVLILIVGLCVALTHQHKLLRIVFMGCGTERMLKSPPTSEISVEDLIDAHAKMTGIE